MSLDNILKVLTIASFGITFGLVVGFTRPVYNIGSAQPGIPANAASSSFATLTAGTVQTLFATSTSGCSSRIITTQAGYLELVLSDRFGAVPNGSYGVYQAASTTVAYDRGLYGCGAVKALSNVTQQVTLVDAR